ncbi:MAG: hypothetical protein ACJATI_002459 [Halioglobus sp.]|jgi:hypothetical protein
MNWPLFAWFLVFVLIRKEGVEKYTTVWGVFLFAAYLKLIYLSKKHQPDMKSQHHKAVSHFDDSVILKKNQLEYLNIELSRLHSEMYPLYVMCLTIFSIK